MGQQRAIRHAKHCIDADSVGIRSDKDDARERRAGVDWENIDSNRGARRRCRSCIGVAGRGNRLQIRDTVSPSFFLPCCSPSQYTCQGRQGKLAAKNFHPAKEGQGKKQRARMPRKQRQENEWTRADSHGGGDGRKRCVGRKFGKIEPLAQVPGPRLLVANLFAAARHPTLGTDPITTLRAARSLD